MIYLDSSALLKLLFEEEESLELEKWLRSDLAIPKVSSQLARMEVVRACRRIDNVVVPNARQLLAGIDLVPITEDIIERAGTVSSPLVRSLDAIHLASALSLGSELSIFVAYDVRLKAAASAELLKVAAPGS
ncbi:hypothetical protein BH23ACT12_BH23ACT12_01310 [soil metagenome]